MSFTAVLGVFVALGVVLALMLVALRVLKRFSPALGGARGRIPMEVVQRIPLGPKHAIAVVRVGDRVLTVAVGEGGVQQLAELDGADRAAVLAASTAPTPFESSRAATAGVAAAIAANPELTRLPGGRWLRGALERRTADAPQRAAERPAPAAPAPRPAPIAASHAVTHPVAGNADAFRSVLGMALSSATKLALLGAALGALAAAPSRAAGQAPAAAPNTATPNVAAPNVATPVVAAPDAAAAPAAAAAPNALPALPAATQAALYQQALRQAALRAAAPARVGAGRNTQAPAPAGTGTAAAPAPLAPGRTAPTPGLAAADTMVARLAPQLDLRVGGGEGQGLRLSGTVGIVVMMGLLTVLPTLVLMMTGFTRILIVLHFLKQALGTQNAPPNHLVAALAMLLTGFVMAPTLSTVNQTAVQPWLAGRIEQTAMMQEGAKPFRAFMLRQTRQRDLQTFVDISHAERAPATPDDVPLVVVMSAFVTSELRTAFQLGFALYLPFIVIDIVVSAVLLSMGMMMLPPAMISLPCKLLLFVLVDGWSLVVQGLVQSFK